MRSVVDMHALREMHAQGHICACSGECTRKEMCAQGRAYTVHNSDQCVCTRVHLLSAVFADTSKASSWIRRIRLQVADHHGNIDLWWGSIFSSMHRIEDPRKLLTRRVRLPRHYAEETDESF